MNGDNPSTNKMASISVVFLIIATPFSPFLVCAILTKEKKTYVNIFIDTPLMAHSKVNTVI
ncbi:hypothetical protein DX038_13020 [Escherichia albertii]|nr:hypothetical protein [Escherichia albertii]